MSIVVTQMHDSLRSFLAKLSLSCLWQGPCLARFSMLKLVSENESCGLNDIPRMKELTTGFQEGISDFRLYENELLLLSSAFSMTMKPVSRELWWPWGFRAALHRGQICPPWSRLDLQAIWELLPPIENYPAQLLFMCGSTHVCELSLPVGDWVVEMIKERKSLQG